LRTGSQPATEICKRLIFVCHPATNGRYQGLQTKMACLQTTEALSPFIVYFSSMTRRQSVLVYIFIIFMMVWGLDLINAAKHKTPVSVADIFNPLNLSQVIYGSLTMLCTNLLAKKYFLTRRYLLFAVAITASIALFIALRYTIEEILYPVTLNIHNYRKDVALDYYALDNVYFAFIYISLGFLFFLLDTQIGNQKKQELLLRKTREAELQFLRSQINPHFLFNTLNNIYSLVYEKSDLAPHAMLKLSGLLRYMLYERKDLVPLNKEWEYIQSFIELERLRFVQQLQINMTTEGDIAGWHIPPYLLIPFIDNGFKHGDFEGNESHLAITLTVTGNQLFFQIENRAKQKNKDQAGGVGLNNIKRRLELLYPGNHILQVEPNDNKFKATLILNKSL
jgi:two-component system, LytTR family, sensor kinase